MKKIAAWIALGVITIGAGLLLSMTNEVTKDVIAKQEAEAVIQARKDVLPLADTFEAVELEDPAPLSELYAGLKDGNPVGYVGTVVVKGYGGPIQVIAGVDETGKVTGISVGGSEFAETAGLGANAKSEHFTEQFVAKQAPLKAVKTEKDRGDNTVDAIAAATITTNAVTGGVNSIASKVSNYLNPPTDLPAEGTTYTASEQGFAGPVAVFVTVKDDGTISGLKVGDDAFAETEGFGAAALEDAFTNSFIGKALPLDAGQVDGISGATITSKAVVAAINKAYEEKNLVLPEGTTYSASEQGFAGPVAVFVTAKDDGTITALTVGDDDFKETDTFGGPARDQVFTSQFVGKTIPVKAEDIDALSGATMTTNAVLAAINRAYEEKLVVEGSEQAPTEPVATEKPEAQVEPTEVPAAEVTAEVVAEVTDAPVETAAPQQAVFTLPTAAPLTGRALYGSAQGYGGTVGVIITLNTDNTIMDVLVVTDGFAETPSIGDKVLDAGFLDSLKGQPVPLAPGAVDTIAGATVSSTAVMNAINTAAARLDNAPGQVADAPSSEVLATAAPLTGRALMGTAEGFGGPVHVVVALQADNTILSVQVLEADFAETSGIGDKVLEQTFLDAFQGKTVPLAPGDVDTISGSTVSSQAVMDAVNEATARLLAQPATAQ